MYCRINMPLGSWNQCYVDSMSALDPCKTIHLVKRTYLHTSSKIWILLVSRTISHSLGSFICGLLFLAREDKSIYSCLISFIQVSMGMQIVDLMKCHNTLSVQKPYVDSLTVRYPACTCMPLLQSALSCLVFFLTIQMQVTCKCR